MTEAVRADVLILGAGPVGLTLARYLAGQGRLVTLAEQRTLAARADDPRALALSHGARQLLEPLGVWPAKAATPIESVHVSQRGGFGRCLMRCTDYRLPALGYVMRYGNLSQALADGITSLPGTTLHENCAAQTVETSPQGAIVHLRRNQENLQVTADLVVHAEGAPDASDGISIREYRQHAIVAEVKTPAGHDHRAWERFTPDGPLALLPLDDGFSLVLTVPDQRVAYLLALDDNAFLAELQTYLGGRLHFTACSPRHAYPLALRLRREVTAFRQVWIGNAAQTLHPVTGQGFNLGLRDVHVLAEAIRRGGRDAGAARTLAGYAQRRQIDRQGSALFTDGIVRLFSNDFAPLRLARGMGLQMLDLLPPARDFVARRMIWGARAWP